MGDLTTKGKTTIGNLLIDTANWSGLTYVALGTNGTMAKATDTKLGNEVVRRLISIRALLDNKMLLSETFPKADCTYYIKEVGIFGDEPENAATGDPDTGALAYRQVMDKNNSDGLKDIVADVEIEIS